MRIAVLDNDRSQADLVCQVLSAAGHSCQFFDSGKDMVAQLRKLMVDEIKIDASFMGDLEKDPSVQAMLLGLGDLARRLKLNCVATGVDTAAQVGFLKKHGWDQAQGTFFGAPLSGLNFAARWLARVGKPTRVAGADGGPHSG